MRSLSALALIVAVVAATSPIPREWPSQHEMVYHYTSQVVNGIPGVNQQYAGLRMSAVVKVQTHPNSILMVKIENPRYKDFSTEGQLQHGKYVSPSGEVEVPSHLKTHLETPFKVYHKRGVVEKLEMRNDEPEVITNIKKSIMSQLQLNLSSTGRSLEQNMIQRPTQSGSVPTYTTMESSFIGECETSYTINPLPTYMAEEFETKEREYSHYQGEGTTSTTRGEQMCQGKQYYEIVKSKNLDNCKERPAYYFATGFKQNCDKTTTTCDASHSSVTRYIVCGTQDSYLIRKVSTENQVIASSLGVFETVEKLQATSRVTLDLISSSPISSHLQEPSSPKVKNSLIFEFPSSHRHMSTQSQKDQIRESTQGQRKMHQSPKPELRGQPEFYLSRSEDIESVKRNVIEGINKVIELSENTPEESYSRENVAALSLTSTVGVEFLSLEDIKSIEREVLSRHSGNQQTAVSVFYDIISLAGSNPAVMFIKEKIQQGSIQGEKASWLISKTITNVKTPTTELIRELISLVKSEQVQGHRRLRSTGILSLTDLIYRACVDPTTSQTQFPVKMYGELCTKSKQEIVQELVPFLKEKMMESSQDQNKLITYVQALGNLGVEEASRELHEVIEGRITSLPQIRSLAVYNLWRSAQRHPTTYRQVLLGLILNNAENPEVRIAAVTILPYTQPQTADLQKVAISTWFSSSRQVSSFISSTLKNLKSIHSHEPEYQSLSEKAKLVYPLCKPSEPVTLPSFNVVLDKYFETLGLTSSKRLQMVHSPRSTIPSMVFKKFELKKSTGQSLTFESAAIMQGSEYLLKSLEQLYDSYIQSTEGQSQQGQKQRIQSEVEKIARQLNIQSDNQGIEPQLHLLVKLFNSQHLYTLDSRFVSEMIQQINSAIRENIYSQERSSGFVKVMDLGKSHLSVPTESGFVLHVSENNPVVSKTVGGLKVRESGSRGVHQESSLSVGFELTLKPVVNYKHFYGAGVICPFTETFLGTGVEVESHMYLPLEVDASLHNGQIRTTLKVPENLQSQGTKKLISVSVKPMTVAAPMHGGVPRLSNYRQHLIQSRFTPKQVQKMIGEKFGLDMHMEIESQHENLDLTSLYSLITKPKVSVKPFKFTIKFNPSSSETKELELITSIVKGSKPQGQEPIVETQEERRICSKYSESQQEFERCVEKLQRQVRSERRIDSQVESWCQQDKSKFLQQQQQQQQQQQSKSQQQLEGQSQSRYEQCKIEAQLCQEEETLCKLFMQKSQRQVPEIQSLCYKVKEECKHKYESRQGVKQLLSEISTGSAYTLHMKAQANGQSGTTNGKVQSWITIGKEQPRGGEEKTIVQVRSKYQPIRSSEFCHFNVDSTYTSKTIGSMWNREEILNERPYGNTDIKTFFGCQGQSGHMVKIDLRGSQSQEQTQYARQSPETQRCQRHESEGRILTTDCQKSRRQARSMDKVEGVISVPSWLINHPWSRMALTAVKAYTLPVLSEKIWTSGEFRGQKQIQVEGKVSPTGQKVYLKLSTEGYEAELKNVRLGKFGEGVLPISTKDSLLSVLVSKVSNGTVSVSCSIENNKVSTFDGLTYNYELNNCEHVVFQERSQQPRVMVTTKKTTGKQYTKVYVYGKKFELEVSSPMRSSRQGTARLSINGQERSDLINASPRYPTETYVLGFRDGVYAIVVPIKGFAILVDGERLEVKSWPLSFRNSIVGLCGDMNDEKTADIKTPGQCVMSSPKLAAFSFMVRDGQCQGIPQQYESTYQQEKQQCVRKQEIPTKVSRIYESHSWNSQSNRQHLTQEKWGKICFSKQMIKKCKSYQQPQQIRQTQVSYVCLRSNLQSQTLKKQAQFGEPLPVLQTYPVEYTRTESEATYCSGL